MDYTTLARLKLEKSIKEVADDTLLSTLITTASRDLDRFCTGTAGPDSDNYFQTATVTNEVIAGWLDSDGSIVFYLHKPAIATVTALAYKVNWAFAFVDVPASLIEINGGPIITGHVCAPQPVSKIWGKVTYSGGLGATVADLPADLIEAATEDAIRIYEENKAGVADAIGTVDTGIMLYNKSLPVRIQRMLQPYLRVRPWREI